MKTTEQWWAEVSADEGKMIDWLKDQYHGEVTAADRIGQLLVDYEVSPTSTKIINRIVEDEKRHARWVKSLLDARGIPAEVLQKEERYWNKVLPMEKSTFTYMCAVGHLAETMRLERIALLAADDRFEDIAEVFSQIISDEVFHAAAFGKMSTPEDIEKARAAHSDGMNAIGLVA